MIYRRLYNVPTMDFRNPLSQLERIRRQMEQAFEGLGGSSPRYQNAGVFPLVNLTEDPENYFVSAELPGVSGETLKVQADGRGISISGERISEAEGDDVRFHRKEREAGKFSRVISLPGEIDTDRIDAKLVNGILTIVVPKAKTVKPRMITIK